MTECGTAAFDVPFQSVSECVRIKTAVSSVLDPPSRERVDVAFSISSLAATLPSSAAASIYLTTSIARLPSVFATNKLAPLSGQLVRKGP